MSDIHPAVQAAAEAIHGVNAFPIEMATKAIQAFLNQIGMTAKEMQRLKIFVGPTWHEFKQFESWAEAIRAVQGES